MHPRSHFGRHFGREAILSAYADPRHELGAIDASPATKTIPKTGYRWWSRHSAALIKSERQEAARLVRFGFVLFSSTPPQNLLQTPPQPPPPNPAPNPSPNPAPNPRPKSLPQTTTANSAQNSTQTPPRNPVPNPTLKPGLAAPVLFRFRGFVFRSSSAVSSGCETTACLSTRS